MATEALAKMGTIALRPVADLATNGDSAQRHSAVRTLVQMLELGTVDKTNSSEVLIKQTLLKAAQDDNPYTRMSALEGLTKVSGNDAKHAIQTAAETDPYTHPQNKKIFPVRELAKKLLEKK
jgi:HEAT repeat protein